jgi:adenosine deaminase
MSLKWHKHEAIKFIYDSFQRHAPGKVGLILSLKYESMRASQRQYAKLIENPVAAECLVGLDLVGDEAYFDHNFYQPIFEDWNKAKKLTRAHVGESQSLLNIVEAMEALKVTNVAHGFKVLEDQRAVSWARNHQVCFDTTITSNYLTDVWQDPFNHPLVAMHREGLMVTIGSDDPIQCSTTLDREFVEARRRGLTDEECLAIQRNAVGLYYRFAQTDD